LAQWYWNLIDEQLVTDDKIRNLVARETEGLATRREKVSALHNWVVQNTRYVALEFGIHGFKPYRTTECLRRRFGDCKDKASLIKVMLEAAGIEANIVLVRTRRNGQIDASPPSLQIFDHAIAYVPEFDLFLDGTAEYSGTSELPWADQGVQVLIIEDGGKYVLRQTPVYPATANSVETSYQVDLRSAVAEVEVTSTLTGSFSASHRQRYETPTGRSERFKAQLTRDFPGAILKSIQFSALGDLEKPVQVEYRFLSPDLAQRDRGSIRVPPLLRAPRIMARLAPWSSRTQPLELGHPFVLRESVALAIPDGTKLKTPAGYHLVKSDFGRLDLTVEKQPNGVKVTATLRVDVWRVEPARYAEFRVWLQRVDQALTTPLVFETHEN
jgi:hypothetical protein